MDQVSFVTKSNNAICTVEKTITWIAFSIMLALLIIQVVCRYVFNWPLAWAEEMVRYTYIAVSFIGATVAVRENSHISIDILDTVLNATIKNKRIKAIVLDSFDMIAALIGLIFWVFMSIWMVGYNQEIARLDQITTANEWPMWLMCLPVTVSCILMGVHSILNIFEKGIEIYKLQKGGVTQ